MGYPAQCQRLARDVFVGGVAVPLPAVFVCCQRVLADHCPRAEAGAAVMAAKSTDARAGAAVYGGEPSLRRSTRNATLCGAGAIGEPLAHTPTGRCNLPDGDFGRMPSGLAIQCKIGDPDEGALARV